MAPPRTATSSEQLSQLCIIDRQNSPKYVTRHPVQLYRQTLEYQVPLLFWLLRAKAGHGELCRSQVYTIPTKPPTRWQFVIWKNKPGEAQDVFPFTSYFKRAEESPGDQVSASGKFTSLYEFGQRVRLKEFNGLFDYNSPVCSFNLTTRSEFKNAREKDFFTLRCELEVLQPDFCNSYFAKGTRNDSVSNCLNNMWEIIDKDDVITVKLDDYECRAHKSILSAQSPVFGAMFQHDTKEKQTNSITIQELDKSVLRLMLQFVYYNKIDEENWNEENASKLLVAADKYMLNGLKDECEALLIEKLSWRNCTQLLKLGNDCSAERLKSEAMNYVSSKLQRSISSLSTLQRKLSDQTFVHWIVNIAAELETSQESSEDSVEEDSVEEDG